MTTTQTPAPTRAPHLVGPEAGDAIWFLGGLITVKAGPDATGGAFSVTEHLFRRGMATPLHVQPGDDESFYVLDGQVTMWLDGREQVLAPGAFALVPRGTPHAFRVDSETARMLAIHSPAGHEVFFARAGDPAGARTLPEPPAGPPDMGRMAAAAEAAGFELLGPPPFAG